MELKVHFEAELSPGNEAHQKQVLEAYLKGKGIHLEPPEYGSDNKIISGDVVWFEIV